jgi:2-polyprenyl-3-methyl-5-hydroxy-6-metoxy-1,4-benzoquinol methylase
MEPQNNQIICPVCGASETVLQFACTDHSISKEVFNVRQCPGCRHRFTFPTPSEQNIGAYYKADHYISHTDTSKGLINKLYKFARRFTLSEKRRFVQRQTGLASGKLLEVGTGTGAFLHIMEEAGWQTTGLEPDFHAREKAMALYKLTVFEPAHLYDLPTGSFDAIVLWHVLEHVYTIHAYMEQFSRLLKPDGLLFIAVPNYTSHDAHIYHEFWAAYDVPRHLHHFCPASLQVLGARFGFKISRQKRMWLDAFYISLLSEKYKYGRFRYLPAFFNGFISNLKTLSNRSKCSSLIYVLKKEATK